MVDFLQFLCDPGALVEATLFLTPRGKRYRYKNRFFDRFICVSVIEFFHDDVIEKLSTDRYRARIAVILKRPDDILHDAIFVIE